VWVDGNYVGYLKELKGKKKVLLLPGQHEVVVRQSGYLDSLQKVVVQPGEKRLVIVALQLAPHGDGARGYGEVEAEYQTEAGGSFSGREICWDMRASSEGNSAQWKSAPANNKIRVELPGYRTFVTEVDLLANQQTEVKTELQVGSIQQNTPIIKKPD
jgi:hypothetical protein